MEEPNEWSIAWLPDGDGQPAGVTVNGFALGCAVQADAEAVPTGATPFGLLAASLSLCTAMSVRSFLRRWQVEPGEVAVHVAFRPGSPPVLERAVRVDAEVELDLREQLAAEVDYTPVTELLRDALPIRTVLTTGGRHDTATS